MITSLPSRYEALDILRQWGCPLNVIKHCEAVSKLAFELANKASERGYAIDIRLVELGGLLHDVGRSQTHSITHLLEGSKIVSSLGFSQTLVNIVERHIGAGIPSEEARKLGLPTKDYIPKTLEEKIVAYADKLVDGSRRITFDEALHKLSIKFGHESPVIERLRKLYNDLFLIIGEST